MGFLSSIFGRKAGEDGRFQTDGAYIQNRATQLAMTPQTVSQLWNHGITEQTHLKLEYFFYTNTEAKAATLAKNLADMGYTGNYDRSVSDKKQFIVNGWTSRMKMDVQTVLNWTSRMCDMGYAHDCEFDGWGTNPQQPEENQP